MRHTRIGSSLLELTIAVAILGALLMMVQGTLTSLNQVDAAMNAEDDVAQDMANVTRIIASDLGQSGWHSVNRLPLPVTKAADRDGRYWPYVVMQDVGAWTGFSSGFTYARRNEDLVLLPRNSTIPSTVLPGTQADAGSTFGSDTAAYLASFRARSQELIFLRQISSQWLPGRPQGDRQLALNFPKVRSDGTVIDWNDLSVTNRVANVRVLYPICWEENPVGSGVFQFRAFDADLDGDVSTGEGGNGLGQPAQAYGLPLFAAAMDQTNQAMSLQWDQMSQPDYKVTNTKDQDLRDFMYAVVPSPFGTGRLVRAYKAGNGSAVMGVEPGQFISVSGIYGMVVDEVLSDHVTRILFDTCRTDASLLLNQVRVRIYFARQAVRSNVQLSTQIVDFVVVMRTRNNQSDRENDLNDLFRGSMTALTLDY